MENRFFDKKNGLWYEKQGDYYLPCLELLYFRLVKQFAESEGITEQLKADNPMEWVGRMGNIQSRCREIVNSEAVFI